MKRSAWTSWGGFLMVAVVPLFVLVLIGLLSGSPNEARRIRNRANLCLIAKGLTTYLQEYGGNRFYPPNLGLLFDLGIVPERGVFVSPLDDNPPKLANGLPCSYEYAPLEAGPGGLPPNQPIAWDRKAFLGGRAVLFADSHVEFGQGGGLGTRAPASPESLKPSTGRR